MNKPLFIPLKREYFEAFASGTKNTEYRIFGPRWNEKVCRVGREVVLSLGYGARHRMTGIIVSFLPMTAEEANAQPGWRECYGETARAGCAIVIQLDAQFLAEATGREGKTPDGSTVAVVCGKFRGDEPGYGVRMVNAKTGAKTGFTLSRHGALLLCALLIEATDFFNAPETKGEPRA